MGLNSEPYKLPLMTISGCMKGYAGHVLPSYTLRTTVLPGSENRFRIEDISR